METLVQKNVQTKNRWIIIISGFLILICLGVAYSWGIFILPITKEFGWTRTSVSFAVSILLLLFSTFMPISGLIEKRIGPKNTSIIGGFFVSIGWLLSSFTKSIFWLYLSYGFLVGIGTGLSYLPSISTGIKWFKEKKGMATGIIVSGFGIGSAFLAPIGIKLINTFGWRKTMFIYGLLFGVIIFTASFFLKTPELINENDIENKVNSFDKLNFTPYQMIRTTLFKLIFITYFFAMVAGMMIITHIVPFLKDIGYDTIQASLSITIISLFNGIGRTLGGFLSDKIGRVNILLLLFFITGMSILFLKFLPYLYIIYSSAALIGFCFGGFLSIYPALTGDFFGTEYFGINYGIVFIGYGLGCFLGPLLGGIFYDKMGNYNLSFTIASITSILGGAIITFCLKKPRISFK
ncbi:MAG: OFA family MFS transporter [bacterium]|nr:OFA family MFS transporter [bacterium]